MSLGTYMLFSGSYKYDCVWQLRLPEDSSRKLRVFLRVTDVQLRNGASSPRDEPRDKWRVCGENRGDTNRTCSVWDPPLEAKVFSIKISICQNPFHLNVVVIQHARLQNRGVLVEVCVSSCSRAGREGRAQFGREQPPEDRRLRSVRHQLSDACDMSAVLFIFVFEPRTLASAEI